MGYIQTQNRESDNSCRAKSFFGLLRTFQICSKPRKYLFLIYINGEGRACVFWIVISIGEQITKTIITITDKSIVIYLSGQPIIDNWRNLSPDKAITDNSINSKF